MKPVFKQIVIGVVPAAVGLAAIGNVAPAENIQWPQTDNAQPPPLPGPQASIWPPPAPAPEPTPRPEFGGGILILGFRG